MKLLSKGLLIIFEGIDGTGKSTQLQLLADHLNSVGYSTITTREPTNGTYGKKIRQLYINRDGVSKEEELQLFIEDRKEHVTKLLNPSLLEGKIVLCDRYYLSTAAYQGAVGFDPLEIIKMNHFAPTPDIAFIFQLSPDLSIERITSGRGDTLNDFEQKESLEKVRIIFNSLKLPFIKNIDASLSIDSVHKRIVNEITPLLEHSHKPV